MRGPVLFVSHDASRTGAPIALLTLLKYFRKHGTPEFEVLLRQDGELVERFQTLARVTHWSGESNEPSMPGAAVRGLWERAPFRRRTAPAAPDAQNSQVRLTNEFATRQISLVYSNTITNGDVLSALKPLRAPVITHVHELEYWMLHRMPRQQLERSFANTDVFIAVCGAVADSVIAMGASADRVVIVRPCIEIDDQMLNRERRAVRAELGVPEHAFVVGSCGTMDWRKGVELLAPLAREVEHHSPSAPVHWIWVGGEQNGPRAGKLQHDFKRCDLEPRLHLTGTLESPRRVFSAFDAFVLLSREDPFPLVMLEAASLELPVLCFDRAGGAPEFVRNDAGFVVPYLDLRAMAARLVDLCANPEMKMRMGRVGRERVLAEHDVRGVAPRILELIEQVRSRPRT